MKLRYWILELNTHNKNGKDIRYSQFEPVTRDDIPVYFKCFLGAPPFTNHLTIKFFFKRIPIAIAVHIIPSSLSQLKYI